MANRYVYSGAGGGATGADWANAHLTMAAAITASAAGDIFYVAHDHNEVTASTLTLTWKGTFVSPDKVLCVNRAGSVPPVAADLRATAIISTSGNISLNPITVANGMAYIEGIIFRAAATGGSAAAAANIACNSGTNGKMRFKNCVFDVSGNTNAGSVIRPSSGGFTDFEDCQVKFGAIGQSVSLNSTGARVRWCGLAGLSILAAGSTVPTNLFVTVQGCRLDVEGLDLSGTANTLCVPASGVCNLRNCKLNGSVTVASATNMIPGGEVNVTNCNSAGVTRNERYLAQGQLFTETTIIRTGGANDGVAGFSWKIVPDADNERIVPFETFEGSIWNSATGSPKTLTIHTVTDNVTLNEAQLWLEVEYLSSSGSPITTRISNEAATILTAGNNHAASTETWTTTGLATPVKQQLAVSFTPQMAGPIRWRVKYSKISTTVYICPKAELS